MYKREKFRLKKGDGKRYRLPEFSWPTDRGRVGESTIYLNRDWGDRFFYSPDPAKFSDGNLEQALRFLGYGVVAVDGEEYFTTDQRHPLFFREEFEAHMRAEWPELYSGESEPSDWEEDFTDEFLVDEEVFA